MPGALPKKLQPRVTAITKVPQEDVDRARTVIARVVARAPRPVLDADVTLNVLPEPGIPRPNLVSLRIDLDGLPLTAYASAPSMPEAIDLAGARLRARIEHVTRHPAGPQKAHRNTASAS